MANIVVKSHVDSFMISDSASDALTSIGALSENEFRSLSSSFIDESEFFGLSSNFVNLSGSNIPNPNIFRNSIQAYKTVFPGPYLSDNIAYINGVEDFEPYLSNSTGSIVWRKPNFNIIAVMGDSITEQGFQDLYAYNSSGYICWARAFLSGAFDYEINGSKVPFAQGGAGSVQIGNTFLPLVTASNARICFVHEGTGDYASGDTPKQSADRILSHWIAIRNSGKIPIASTILPVWTTIDKSNWIVETNRYIRINAETNGILLCDWTGELENIPNSNSGISNSTWMPDGTHPGKAGAKRLGKFLSKFLRQNFIFTLDPWNIGGIPVSRNYVLSGSAGQPTDWLTPSVPSGGLLISKALSSDSITGGNWWILETNQLSATSDFFVTLNFNNIPSLSGLSAFAICEVNVLSGLYSTLRLRFSSPFNAWDLDDQSINLTDSILLSASEGLLTLRTPVMYIPSNSTYITPSVRFTGTGKIAIRRPTIYSV